MMVRDTPALKPGRITALRFQKKAPDRVNLYIDGQFAMGLPAVEAARLRVGQALDAEDIERLQSVDARQRAYDSVVRYLSYRPRSIAEVRRYLKDREIDSSLGEAIIEKLQRFGYLDDRAFALWWLDNRAQFNPRGSYAIRQELRIKGVTDDIVEDIIGEAIEKGHLDSLEHIEGLAAARARRLVNEDSITFRRRLGAYLVRRGFAYGDVRSVVDRLWQVIETAHAKGLKPEEIEF